MNAASKGAFWVSWQPRADPPPSRATRCSTHTHTICRTSCTRLWEFCAKMALHQLLEAQWRGVGTSMTRGVAGEAASQECRATWGCSNYTAASCATLCHLGCGIARTLGADLGVWSSRITTNWGVGNLRYRLRGGFTIVTKI